MALSLCFARVVSCLLFIFSFLLFLFFPSFSFSFLLSFFSFFSFFFLSSFLSSFYLISFHFLLSLMRSGSSRFPPPPYHQLLLLSLVRWVDFSGALSVRVSSSFPFFYLCCFILLFPSLVLSFVIIVLPSALLFPPSFSFLLRVVLGTSAPPWFSV